MPNVRQIKKGGAVNKRRFHSKHANMPDKKGPGRAKVSIEAHFLNLRCPNDGCNYLAKTTNLLLEKGRLRCPIHHVILRTKEERGETRGRHHTPMTMTA